MGWEVTSLNRWTQIGKPVGTCTGWMLGSSLGFSLGTSGGNMIEDGLGFTIINTYRLPLGLSLGTLLGMLKGLLIVITAGGKVGTPIGC